MRNNYDDPYYDKDREAKREAKDDASVDKWEAMKQDGELLEPVTTEESIEHFETTNN